MIDSGGHALLSIVEDASVWLLVQVVVRKGTAASVSVTLPVLAWLVVVGSLGSLALMAEESSMGPWVRLVVRNGISISVPAIVPASVSVSVSVSVLMVSTVVVIKRMDTEAVSAAERVTLVVMQREQKVVDFVMVKMGLFSHLHATMFPGEAVLFPGRDELCALVCQEFFLLESLQTLVSKKVEQNAAGWSLTLSNSCPRETKWRGCQGEMVDA